MGVWRLTMYTGLLIPCTRIRVDKLVVFQSMIYKTKNLNSRQLDLVGPYIDSFKIHFNIFLQHIRASRVASFFKVFPQKWLCIFNKPTLQIA
jgi:hypothetical protein